MKGEKRKERRKREGGNKRDADDIFPPLFYLRSRRYHLFADIETIIEYQMTKVTASPEKNRNL